MSDEKSDLERLYRQRFPEHELQQKNSVWHILCADFFQRYVDHKDTVVDIGAGYCEFINNIRAETRIAVDLNPDTRRFASPDVRILNQPSTDISDLPSSSVDVVFMSNFLEHLPSKREVLATLTEARRILRDGGRILVMQPNIRFLPGEYWDYFDHHTPLTDRSLVEGLKLAGFTPAVVHPRFLPYTMKARLPKTPFLVRLYLRLPWTWRFFGKQAFVMATKNDQP